MFNSLRRRVAQFLALVPFWAWVATSGCAGGVIGLGGFTFSYAEGASYFSDDPRSCANCHVMRDVYDGWQRGSHRAVAVCNDCHTPHTSFVEKYAVKGINGFNHSTAFTLQNYPSAIQITSFNRGIAQGSCADCHANLVGYITHSDSNSPTDCLSCHAGVGHGK